MCVIAMHTSDNRYAVCRRFGPVLRIVQNVSDDGRGLDSGNHFNRSTALVTGFDIDLEYSFEALGHVMVVWSVPWRRRPVVYRAWPVPPVNGLCCCGRSRHGIE